MTPEEPAAGGPDPQARAAEGSPGDIPPLSRRRLLLRWIGLALIALAVLFALYGGVALAAYRDGLRLQDERARQALEEELARQLELANADVENGNLDLARLRLAWIVGLEPDYASASELARRIEAAAAPRPTASPPPVPTNTAEAGIPAAAAPPEQLAHLERLMAREAWVEAIAAIITFQAGNPDYERLQTDAWLYQSYVEAGLELLAGDQIERGLYYLHQAEQLGPLPQAARDRRLWAALYLQGMAYRGLDWGRAAAYLRDVCLAAPYFHDSCRQLRDSLIALADQHRAQGEPCLAEPLYAEALALEPEDDVAARRAEAGDSCAQATPIPAEPPAPADEPADPTP